MLNIIIPAAGLGSRFKQCGYLNPKPIIDVVQKPMIEWVVSNIKPKNEPARFIFLFQKEHLNNFPIRQIILDICNKYDIKEHHIVEIDGLTEGAACTVLKAQEFFNNEDECIVVNSDQYVLNFDVDNFLQLARQYKNDGLVLTFKNTNKEDCKWSFVNIDRDTGLVIEVAEKEHISDFATIGLYWVAKGNELVKYINSMILKNRRVKNEFYFFMTYKEYIEDNKKIRIYNILDKEPFNEKMLPFGTPIDLENSIEILKTLKV